MSDRINKTQFEVNGAADGRKRGTLTGVDVNMRDFLAIAETLMKLGWPIPPETLISNYKDVVDDLVQALVQTVEYVGPPTLPAIEGWSWFDALSKYAPDTAAKFKYAWGKPEDQLAHANTETIRPRPGQIFQSPPSDESWPLGAHPAHASWAQDGTATDYEQYVKGWDACLKSLMDESEKIGRIGQMSRAELTNEDLELFDNSPVTHCTSSVLWWLTKKVYDHES